MNAIKNMTTGTVWINTELTLNDASLLRGLVASERAAYHNHIAGAVECGQQQYADTGMSGFEYARDLTRKLRELERVYAKLNGLIIEANKLTK